MKLIRHTTADIDNHFSDERGYRKMRGRVANFSIFDATLTESDDAERILSAMEELLAAKGWEDECDNCPLYEEGYSCGYYVACDEVENFKASYKEAKKELKAYLAKQAA